MAKLRNPQVNPLQVAGQAFFITNGEPCYFWDFARRIWHQLDAYFPDHRKPRDVFKLSKDIGLIAAGGAELYGKLVGKEPAFTRYKVSYSCATRWHNVEKARRILNYEPEVGLDEGIQHMVRVSCVSRALNEFGTDSASSGGMKNISKATTHRNTRGERLPN
jgi:sterol-4alpha-carboxylate 3-dehydrogenase (decarboxylating)